MQVDPIKPNLEPPGTKLFKLEYDYLLSSFGFSFNLRRYNMVCFSVWAGTFPEHGNRKDGSPTFALMLPYMVMNIGFTAGAYTRPLLS